jgi:hypothetical protein
MKRPARTDVSTRQWSFRAVIFGFAYFVVGIVFGALAGSAAFDQAGVFWNRAAWAASGLLYLTHIAYEHFRLRNSPLSIAIHAASGAAVGGFGLAVAAAVHALKVSQFRPAYVVALFAWPAVTAVPAFLVALSVAALLARFARR